MVFNCSVQIFKKILALNFFSRSVSKISVIHEQKRLAYITLNENLACVKLKLVTKVEQVSTKSN
jgi:hypothetical protein